VQGHPSPSLNTRLFDRFYRAVPVGDIAPTGSGLGLALGRWIVERHHTELCVDSEPGCGTCFSFGLQRTYSDLPANDAICSSRVQSAARLKLPSSTLSLASYDHPDKFAMCVFLRSGHKQRLCLPPYAPDLNFIEKARSKFTQFPRSAIARSREALGQADTLKTITAENSAAWFRHCGYRG